MKQCLKCSEVKDYSQFSKCKARKDGLQDRCKQCNKVDNLRFRKEINPEHHAKWQKENIKKVSQLVRKYRKADKTGVVYALINSEGEVYVGETKTHLKVRLMEHRVKYKRFLEGKLKKEHPLLFESFEKYGIDNHRLEILFEDKDISKKDLKLIEKSFIKAFKENGNSLNVKL